MDTKFENIVPWNGSNDTGRDVRLKWERNFKRIADALKELSDTDKQIIKDILKEIDEIFLHKDKEDGTPFPITFGDWVKFGEFITGISGGCIDKNGILEMEEGIFRKRVFFPEVAYNRVTYFKGRMCASPGGGCTVKEWSDNGDGSYTITPDLTDADGLSQFVDDILTTYFVTKSPEGKLQGFEEMKFRVTSADYTAKTFVMTPKPGTDWKPGMRWYLPRRVTSRMRIDRRTFLSIRLTATTALLSSTTPIPGMSSLPRKSHGLAKERSYRAWHSCRQLFGCFSPRHHVRQDIPGG